MAEPSDRNIAHVHDKFFKDQFQQLDLARTVLSHLLPEEIAGAIDWSKLAPEETAFVDEALTGSACDLLFRTEYRTRPALIHLLFEHQSAPDRSMPLRLLRYMTQIWQRYCGVGHTEGPPIVIPIVFHQGVRGWPYSTSFQSWLGLPANDPLVRHQPAFEYVLIDLPQIDLQRVQIPVREKLTLLLMKCVRENRLEEFLDDLEQLFVAFHLQTDDAERVAVLLRYLLKSESPRQNRASTIGRLVSSINNEKPSAKIMTIEDEIIEEGRQEGRQEGILIGQVLAFQEMTCAKARTPAELAALSCEQLVACLAELKRQMTPRP